jgi:hypothetical protein
MRGVPSDFLASLALAAVSFLFAFLLSCIAQQEEGGEMRGRLDDGYCLSRVVVVAVICVAIAALIREAFVRYPKTACAALIFVVMLISHVALAHSWYDLSCCSTYDCAPVEGKQVEERGYDTYFRGDLVPPEKIKDGKDEFWHACLPLVDGKPVLRCLYRPIRGT